MTSQHGQCRNLVRAFLSWVLPIPATPPYAVRPLHMHGATDYGGYHLGGLKMLTVRFGKVVRDIPWRLLAARIQAGRGCPEFLAGLGGPGGQRAPHRQDGRERRDAPYVTHSVFWRAGAQNVRENVTYFEHQEKEQMLLTNQSAKYVTHTNAS